jgi:CBS domain-containing protein
MKVTEILKVKGTAVHTVAPNTAMRTAVDRMVAAHIGALVVVETDGALSGVLSERDVVHALARVGHDVLALPVSEVMSRQVITCTTEDRLADLMETMTKRRVRHLPVVEEGRLVGLVSIGDLVNARLHELEIESNVMRDAYLRVR